MFGFLRKFDKSTKDLDRNYKRLLEEARDLQRKGDIKGFAAKTAEAEEVGKKLEAARDDKSS